MGDGAPGLSRLIGGDGPPGEAAELPSALAALLERLREGRGGEPGACGSEGEAEAESFGPEGVDLAPGREAGFRPLASPDAATCEDLAPGPGVAGLCTPLAAGLCTPLAAASLEAPQAELLALPAGSTALENRWPWFFGEEFVAELTQRIEDAFGADSPVADKLVGLLERLQDVFEAILERAAERDCFDFAPGFGRPEGEGVFPALRTGSGWEPGDAAGLFDGLHLGDVLGGWQDPAGHDLPDPCPGPAAAPKPFADDFGL